MPQNRSFNGKSTASEVVAGLDLSKISAIVTGASGGLGADQLSGGLGADDMQGDDGNDSIKGGTGEDVVYGGAGDDTIHVADGAPPPQMVRTSWSISPPTWAAWASSKTTKPSAC